MLMVPAILQVAVIGLMILIPTLVIYKKASLNPMWAGLVFCQVSVC
jgi:hypothetical protein